MGMNYYARFNICPHCGRYDDLHIGQSRMGWTFIFRGYKEHYADDVLGNIRNAKIESYRDWLSCLKSNPGSKIYDEENREVSLKDFKKIVKAKKKADRSYAIEYTHSTWLDQEGHAFTGEWFQ